MKKYFFLFLVFVLAACSAGNQSELSRNQQLWEDAGITHYRFQLAVTCFCPVGGLMPMTVEVQDGEVVSIVDVNGNPFPSTDPMSDFVLQYATIDRLFAELGSDRVQEADKVTAMFDPTYGFPTDVTIDFIERAIDDELYLSAAGFEPLP